MSTIAASYGWEVNIRQAVSASWTSSASKPSSSRW